MNKINVIFDELRQNEIDFDKQTLSFRISAILDHHRDLYRAVNALGLNLDQVHREINMTNFGRIFAYLAPASFGGVDSIYRVVKDEGKHQISRNKIRLWLQKQDTYTLHKPVRYRFKRNRVIVGAIDEQWEADLVIMDSISKYNNGFKYILTVIDVLSKYAWAEPIKTKTGENLVKAFEKILKKGRKPETFHTDKGTEFMNRKFQAFLKKHNIRFFTTQNETKASIVERFNRTLKTKMWKYFTAKNTLKYVDILQKLVKSYNHSRHRSIGMRPVDVNEDNESIVWQKRYGEESDKPVRFKFNIGDQVRIGKARRTFKKGYLPSWTEEVFTITKR
ncbi:uncharacterized transposon-derived, partial [Paramuricea clavata]